MAISASQKAHTPHHMIDPVKLEHIEIYRGSNLVPFPYLETRECTFRTDISGRAFTFRFDLAARLADRGGGTAEVSLQVGLDDLPLILDNIADVMRQKELRPHSVKLENTKILRGATAPPLYRCEFITDISERTLEFSVAFDFDLAPGSTDVDLRIGLDDLPLILENIAGAMRKIKFGK